METYMPFCRIVANKIQFLDPVKDAAIIWSEIEILNNEGESYNPKQYQLNSNILDAYNTTEMNVRQMQLDSIRERYPKEGEMYPF